MTKKRLRFSNTESESQPTISRSMSHPSQPFRPHTSSQPPTIIQGSSNATLQNSSHAPPPNSAQPEEEIFDDEVDMSDGSTTRNKRGITHLPDIWNLSPGKKIIVDFNAAQLPVGYEGSLFNRFIGTIARKPHLCPINYNSWRYVPSHYKEDCWHIIESKFTFPDDPGVREQIKHNTLKSLGEKLKDWRCTLKSRYYDASKTPAQIVAAAPAMVNREHYAELVNYWYTEDAKLRSEANKKQKENQQGQHTAGSKTYSQHAYTMEKDTGVAVTRTSLYIPTHTRKDKSVINETASENIRQIKELMESQPPSSEENAIGKIGWASNDIYSQVIGGKEHYGRVRGLGFGHTPKNCGSTSSNDTRLRVTSDEERMRDKEIIKELQDKLETQDNMLNTLRTQVEFLLRQSGLQAQDCIDGIRDQVSPHMHQVSSNASREMDHCGLGNRTI